MQQQLSPIRKKPQLQTGYRQKQARADNKAGHEAFLQARISRSSGFPQKRACVGFENLRQLCQRLQIRFGSSELPAADALARDMEPVRQLLLGQPCGFPGAPEILRKVVHGLTSCKKYTISRPICHARFCCTQKIPRLQRNRGI